MITFLLIAMLSLGVVAAIVKANVADERKRRGQSGSAGVPAQQTADGRPEGGRFTGES